MVQGGRWGAVLSQGGRHVSSSCLAEADDRLAQLAQQRVPAARELALLLSRRRVGPQRLPVDVVAAVLGARGRAEDDAADERVVDRAAVLGVVPVELLVQRVQRVVGLVQAQARVDRDVLVNLSAVLGQVCSETEPRRG